MANIRMTENRFESANLENCPACGSKAIGSAEIFDSSFVRPFNQVCKIEIASCTSCNFLFQKTPPTQRALNYYYENSAQMRHTEADIVEEHVHAQQADFFMSGYLGNECQVLEVGSSSGRFLSHLRKLYGVDTWFDELNIEAKKHLKDKLGHSSAYETDPNMKFDFIVLRHVLEHILNPVSFLEELSSKLSTAGKIFIEVPDFTFIDSETDTLLFEHLSYFSSKTLTLTLDRAGLGVEKLEHKVNAKFFGCPDRVLRVLARPYPKENGYDAAAQLQSHLKRKVDEKHSALNTIVTDLDKNETVAFYSASWWTDRALRAISIDDKKVIGIFDKDLKKIGEKYAGLTVLDPATVLNHSPSVIFILTSFEEQIKDDLRRLGYRGRVIGYSEL